jgi:hypothetical protein
MIKKLAVLGTVLAGAALLQNKERRERLTQSAQGFIKTARERLGQVTQQMEDGASKGSSESSYGSTGAGATSRYSGTSGHVTGSRNGIY